MSLQPGVTAGWPCQLLGTGMGWDRTFPHLRSPRVAGRALFAPQVLLPGGCSCSGATDRQGKGPEKPGKGRDIPWQCCDIPWLCCDTAMSPTVLTLLSHFPFTPTEVPLLLLSPRVPRVLRPNPGVPLALGGPRAPTDLGRSPAWGSRGFHASPWQGDLASLTRGQVTETEHEYLVSLPWGMRKMGSFLLLFIPSMRAGVP